MLKQDLLYKILLMNFINIQYMLIFSIVMVEGFTEIIENYNINYSF